MHNEYYLLELTRATEDGYRTKAIYQGVDILLVWYFIMHEQSATTCMHSKTEVNLRIGLGLGLGLYGGLG